MAQLSVGEVCEVALLEVLEGGDFKVALAAASDGNWEHSVGSHWGRPLMRYSDRAGTISNSLEQVTGPGLLCTPTFRKDLFPLCPEGPRSCGTSLTQKVLDGRRVSVFEGWFGEGSLWGNLLEVVELSRS